MASDGAELAALGADMQDVLPTSGSSAAPPPLPKTQSWGTSGLQALIKQPSAGGTNLADLLTEPEGDAGASPLFKWTSDGSMMEELMKVYKESSPSTPTFAQQGSLSRDNSFKEHPLFKDGSFTASLQAAFHSHLEDVAEEQSEAEQAQNAEGTLARSSSGEQAVMSQVPALGSPPDTEPFSFNAFSAEGHDSPQLQAPFQNLAPQPGHMPRPPSEGHFHASATEQALPPTARQSLPDQAGLQLPAQRELAQHAQQGFPQQHYCSGGFAFGAPQMEQIQPVANQSQYQSQVYPPPNLQVPSHKPVQVQQLSQQPHTYAQMQQQPVVQQGGLEAQLGSTGLQRATVTSGSMGSLLWTRPNSRPSSGASHKSQGSSSGSPPGSHQVQSADGSMQAFPRIVVRTSTPPQANAGAPTAGPQQEPVVLQSRVLNTSHESPQTSMGSADTSGASASHQLAANQPRPASAASVETGQFQQPSMPYRQLLDLPLAQAPAPPAQYHARQTPLHTQANLEHHQQRQQQHQQQHQQQQHQQPQIGSFQELLSAPVLPDRYNSAPFPELHQANAPHQLQPHYELNSAHPSQLTDPGQPAIYSSHVLQSSMPLSYPLYQQRHQASSHLPSYPPLQYAQPSDLQSQLSFGGYQQLQTSLPLQYGVAPATLPGFMHPASSAFPTSAQPQDRHSTMHQMLSAQRLQGQQQQQQQQQQQHYLHQPLHSQHQHQHLYGHGHAQPIAAPLELAQQPSSLPSSVIYPRHDLAQHMDARASSLTSGQSSHSAQQPGMHVSNAAQPSRQQPMQQARQQQPAGISHMDYAMQQPMHVSQAFAAPVAPELLLQHPPQAAQQHSGKHVLDVLGLGQAALGQGPGHPGHLQQPVVLSGRPSRQLLQTHVPSQGTAVYASGAMSDALPSQGLASWQSDPGPHGSILLTSHPAAPPAKATGKVVSFAPDPTQEGQGVHQHAAIDQMPTIPGPEDSLSSESRAKENDKAMAGSPAPPVPSGRKFKRDRSSKNNSFSLPPVPPKKPATAVADFSPASSLEFALHGAASAPISQELDLPAQAAPVRHVTSCLDLTADTAGRPGKKVTEPTASSSAADSSDKSVEMLLTAECTIDFSSAVWKAMSRKEKNRASAAASRARKEAYTESLEDKVRKLQEEHDWLQSQIEPGRVVAHPQEGAAAQPNRPPIRHLSF